MVAVCAVVVLLVSWRQPRLRVPLSTWAGLGGVVLVVAAFPYVNAWALTGNPVFPMFNQWFGSPLFDTDMNFTNSLFRHPLSYRTLFDMTFESGRFMECTTGTMGFHYLVLWPLGVAWTCVRRAPDLWIVLATSVGFFVAVFVFQSYLRYLYPALALATISMCAGAQGLVGGARFARLEFARLELARLAMPMLLLAVFGLNIYNLPAAGSTCGDFPLHDLIAGRREKLRSMIPEYGIIQYVRARYGHDARVCCASNSFVANLEGRALTWTWHSPKFAREMSAAATAEQLAAVVAAYGIRHFIVSGPPGSELFDAYLRESTALEYREGRASLYQVRSKGR
jgi:hypothetical protein